MLQTVVLVTHVLIAVLIVGLVLLQRGKGAEAGAAFGAGASGTVFGSRGSANFMSRSTAVLATMFFLSSLTLAFFSGQRSEPASLMEQAVPGAGTRDRETVITPIPGDLPELEQPPLRDEEDEVPSLD
ncbi:MAG: preprotein translocase subunit SecG [Gammaproteobacteria bacterium]|nr:MAG: preprotein translocase subunit SecG [Gammaproteobacteria bacterium]